MLQVIGILGGLLVLAAAALWLWMRRQIKRRQTPPLGIVLLLGEPKPVNAELIAFLFGKVTGREFKPLPLHGAEPAGPDDDSLPAGDIVVGQAPSLLAKAGDALFIVNSVPKPYVECSGEAIGELRARHAVETHQAWLSVDILHHQDASLENYRVVCRIIAELIGPGCLAMYHPESGKIAFPSTDLDQTLELLRSSEDPIDAIFGVQARRPAPVIQIDDDPRMQAAEAEARRRFAEFEAAFHAGQGADFSVKAKLGEADRFEHIWIQVDGISGETVSGCLGNDPVALPGLRLGSKVSIAKAQVEDWVFRKGSEPLGMFTVPVIMQIEKERNGPAAAKP